MKNNEIYEKRKEEKLGLTSKNKALFRFWSWDVRNTLKIPDLPEKKHMINT